MTFSRAVKTYLAGNPVARKMVDRIMKWNPKMTLEENTSRMGLQMQDGYATVRRYKLNHVPYDRKKHKTPNERFWKGQTSNDQ